MKVFFVTLVIIISATFSMAADLLPESVKQAIARSEVADSHFLASSEDFQTLKQFSLGSWRQFLPRLGELGLDEKDQRKLLLATIGVLPDQEYLPFISQSLRLYAGGQLPMSVGTDFIFPYKNNKEGFLALNYQNPELASALRAALPKFSSNPDAKAYVDQVLSGVAKTQHIKWTMEQGLQTRPPVTTAALIPTPDPAAATPDSATPTPSTPVPTATPIASPAPTRPVAQSSPPVVARKSPVWPWVAGGILVLVVIVALALKRRT